MLKKTFRQMVVAQVISGLTVLMCLLIDSIMIGRFLGEQAMAAYGLANPVFLIFAAIGNTISAGVQVVCGKTLGRGDQEATNVFYSVTVVLYLVVSVLGMVLLGSFSGSLATLLGAGTEGQLHNDTRDFLLGFVPGIPLFLASMLSVPFLQLAGRQTLLVIGVALMIVCDVVFDLMNVMVFKGGMLGMSLASSFSYFLPCVAAVGYMLSKKSIFRFRRRLVHMKDAGEILANGVPTLVNLLSSTFTTYAFNLILLNLAKDAAANSSVAAYSIISTASNICYAFTSGIGGVTLMLAGVYYYENDKRSIHSLLKIMLRTEAAVTVIIVSLVLLLAPGIVQLFTMEGTESAAAAIAVGGLRIVTLSIIFNCFATGMKQYYQGILRIRLAELISFLQSFLFPTLSAFILSRFFGTTGVWLGLVFGEALSALFIVIYVFCKEKKPELSIANFSLLPRDFGVPDDHYLRASLSSVDEVVAFSTQAAEFCKSHKANARCCYYTSLCIEEVGVNILTHGYSSKAQRNAEISLFLLASELVIRFRDEGKPFDPVEYYNMLETDDPTAHLGIKMVFKLAKDARYTNSMSQNSLTLTLDTGDFAK